MTPSTPAADVATVTLPKTYWRLLLQFLEEHSDTMSCAGCNDFPITLTPENEAELGQLLRDIDRGNGEEPDEDFIARKLARGREQGRVWFMDAGLLGLVQQGVKAQTQLKPLSR